MGWQTNRILETIGTATGGTQSINFNLEAIEALMVTLQADVADGIRPPNSTTGGTGPTVMLGTATASTSAFSVRLSSGDYYEVPSNYTGLIGGIFATAGTAEVTELS